MIVNDRYVVVLKALSWEDVGEELLEISPQGDGRELIVDLTRDEEEFLFQVGGLASAGDALVAMILGACENSGRIPGTLNHTYCAVTRVLRT